MGVTRTPTQISLFSRPKVDYRSLWSVRLGLHRRLSELLLPATQDSSTFFLLRSPTNSSEFCVQNNCVQLGLSDKNSQKFLNLNLNNANN